MNEFDLIDKYFKPLTNIVGRNLKDDAAVFSSSRKEDFVISTDTLVQKIHFVGDERPDVLAKKALRVNLSDIAAMGAKPLFYNLSLSLPKKIAHNFIYYFSRGLRSDQKKFGVYLIGGDLTSSEQIVITISIIGSVPKGKSISRSGARDGDNLYVTGILGLANIGLGKL